MMVLSIALLVLFQAYWLRKTYRNEFMGLRRELSVLFRETSIRSQMQQMLNDSSFRYTNRGDVAEQKSLTVIEQHSDPDSAKRYHGKQQQFQITIKADSGKMRQPPRMFAFDPDRRGDQQDDFKELVVVAPMFGDAKNLHNIDTAYARALAENGFDLHYSMRKQERNKPDSAAARDTVRFDFSGRRRMQFNNLDFVEIHFENPFWTVVPKMGWPLFFSFMMMLITISAFVFMYRSLKNQYKLAELKNNFISNVTHELKTPIATVGVAIEALKNFNAMNDPQRTGEYLDISSNELHRLGLLVDKVLKLSMFEQDQMEIRNEQLDMAALADEVLASMKLQFEKAGANVQLEKSAGNFTVKGDRLHLLSVLYNLLDNALKYSVENPAIHVALSNEGNNIKLSVRDNGMGIPVAYRNKVFDKFFRVPHGDIHNIKGYGLGLSYVAEVVRKHGGTIQVNAVAPTGSEFVVTLPMSSA